jgi:hypothetical protein
MREWAKDAKVEWAMDRKAAMPSDKEMAKMAIEDAGAAAILPGYERAGGAHGAAPNMISRSCSTSPRKGKANWTLKQRTKTFCHQGQTEKWIKTLPTTPSM